MADDPFAAYQAPASADPFAAYQQASAPDPNYARAGGPVPGRPPGVGLLPGLTEGSANPFPEQGVIPTAQQFGRNIWNGAKGIVENLGHVGRVAFPESYGPNPDDVEALKQGATAQAEQLKTAKRAAQGTGEFEGMSLAGRASEVFGHGLAGLSPGFGPPAATAGEKFQRGDISGGIADTAALGTMMAAPELVGKGLSKIPVPSQGTMLGADPTTLTWQTLQPRGGFEEHVNTAPTVMGDIKASAVKRNWKIQSATDVKDAAEAAQKDNRSIYDQHWDYLPDSTRIPTDKIGDYIDQTISPKTRFIASGPPSEEQAAAQAEVDAIHNYAQTFRGRSVSKDEFRQMQQQVNADVDTFERQTDPVQAKKLAQWGGTKTLDAEARAYRDINRDLLGEDAADAQYRYGRLNDWRVGALKAMDRAAKEKSGTTAQTLLKVADIPGKIIEGQVEDIPTSFRGKTDSGIKWAFDVTKPGAPVRGPQGIRGTNAAVSNIFPGVNAQRLLPQGSAPLTQGTTAINPAANPPRGPQANPYRAGLLGPGSPTQGQGVIQVPPAGAGWSGPSANAQFMAYRQTPFSPREAAAPADTSFVRGVPATRATPVSGPTEPAYHATRSAGDVEGILRRGAIYPAGDPGNTSGFVSTTTRPTKNYAGAPAYLEIDPSKTPLEPYDYFSGKPKQVNGQTVPGYEGGPNDPRFEHEFRARGPVPVSSIKAIHINPNLGADDANFIKSSAARAGVPVVDGSPAFTQPEPLAQRLARAAWKAIKPKAEDIDFQQRYGEKEPPDVARFLGHE